MSPDLWIAVATFLLGTGSMIAGLVWKIGRIASSQSQAHAVLAEKVGRLTETASRLSAAVSDQSRSHTTLANEVKHLADAIEALTVRIDRMDSKVSDARERVARLEARQRNGS